MSLNLTIVSKRPNGKGLYYLKANDRIIKRSFNKKKLLAIKKGLESGEIDIDDLKYNTILEKDISRWEMEL